MKYMHNGGPHEDEIIVKKLGFQEGMYKLEIGITDPTDYERFTDWLYSTWPNVLRS